MKYFLMALSAACLVGLFLFSNWTFAICFVVISAGLAIGHILSAKKESLTVDAQRKMIGELAEKVASLNKRVESFETKLGFQPTRIRP